MPRTHQRAMDALARIAATAPARVSNRRGGPEGLIDLVEARAPDGFDDIEAVASYEEHDQIVRGYTSLAGFAAGNAQSPAGWEVQDPYEPDSGEAMNDHTKQRLFSPSGRRYFSSRR